MIPFKGQLLALLLLGSTSFAQSNTVIYGNASDRLGILTGWQTRDSVVIFNDIGTFSLPIGGLAVSSVDGYSVSFESPSIYSRFALSDPSTILESGLTDVNALDSLVYDSHKRIVYAHSDQGQMYSFAEDGTQTSYGTLSGLGVEETAIQWGSHGDLAIAPDSTSMYQIGFDLTLQNDTSLNWHSLLLIDTSDLLNAIRIAHVPTTYGLIWGLAFDDFGNLFGVTSESYMVEIDTISGDILWYASIMDTSEQSVAMWDLASNPHLIPEPSGMALTACGLIGLLGFALRRKKQLASA